MPRSAEQYYELVFRKLSPAQGEVESGLFRGDIEAAFVQGCQILAERARMFDPTVRPYLTTALNVTAVAGVVNLASEEQLLLESLGNAVITSGDSPYPWVPVENPGDLYFPLPDVWVYYAIQGNALVTRFGPDIPDALAAVVGSVAIENVVFIPVVAAVANNTTVPDQCEDALVDILAALLATKISGRHARAQAEGPG